MHQWKVGTVHFGGFAAKEMGQFWPEEKVAAQDTTEEKSTPPTQLQGFLNGFIDISLGGDSFISGALQQSNQEEVGVDPAKRGK